MKEQKIQFQFYTCNRLTFLHVGLWSPIYVSNPNDSSFFPNKIPIAYQDTIKEHQNQTYVKMIKFIPLKVHALAPPAELFQFSDHKSDPSCFYFLF